MGEVKLYGYWYSPFALRVVWTLKLKGIPYDYIEVNRHNKSPQFLQYNPIYKKVPVLVHDGKPICESMIIVEYIDEIWPQNTLVPAGPYDKAQARFWIKYIDDTVDPRVEALYVSKGDEEQKKGIENVQEVFRVIEEQCLSNQKKFFGGDTINIVDIALGSLAKFVEFLEGMFEVEVLEAERFPHFHSWFNNFKDVPAIKDNIPDHDKYVAFAKLYKEEILASS